MTTPRKPYDTDITDAEWAFVGLHITLMPIDAGQRRHDLREVPNALRWMIRAGSPRAAHPPRPAALARCLRPGLAMAGRRLDDLISLAADPGEWDGPRAELDGLIRDGDHDGVLARLEIYLPGCMGVVTIKRYDDVLREFMSGLTEA